MFQTEFDFVLPKGFVDDNGGIHREGTMRLATALDEIAPLEDPRVRNNEAYVVIVLLARVIVRLGTLKRITPYVIENMYAADIAFLQDLYQQINDLEERTLVVECPNCRHEFDVSVPFLGE
jgi:hypothetical protein